MITGLPAVSARSRSLLVLAPFACVVAALPASAAARTSWTRASHTGSLIGTIGGAGGGSRLATSKSRSATAPVLKLAAVVTATGDGITISVAGSGTTKRPLTITGTAPATVAGSTIEIETAPASTGRIWTRVVSAVVGRTGAFAAVWVPKSSGRKQFRALLVSRLATTPVQAETGSNGGGALPSAKPTASNTAGTSSLQIPIFKGAIATMYGPGFWGHHTACGERLRKTTLGVASRTLKCGTIVKIEFNGREITVPVIDRGPFATKATWDLTWATGKALGMKATSTIGTLS